MPPCREHGDHLLRDLSFVQKHPEHLVPENGLQLFQLQRRGDAEHTFVAIDAVLSLPKETAVRDEGVGDEKSHRPGLSAQRHRM